MALVLKVGSFDFSPFLRVAHEDGMDPANPEYSEPQFGGSPAFGEGRRFAGESVDNRQHSYPLILKAKTSDALYQLVREIDAALVRGTEVEYRGGGASASTFFFLEAGRFDPEYQFWLDQSGRTRGTLHLWTQPRGNTGTTRQVVSEPAGSAAVMQFDATGIIGDRPALSNFEMRVGSAVASNGRVIAYGVHPHPSFNGLHSPTPGLAQAGATMRGASGAVGSQFLAIPVSPTTASGIAYTAFLTPPDAHVGRHRVLAIARSGLNVPLSIYGQDRFGAAIGATALATQTDVNKWQLLDLGEVQVPSRMPGQEPVPTQSVSLIVGGASGGQVNASPGFHLNRLVFLPLDAAAAVLGAPGLKAKDQVYFQDNFTRLTDYSSGLGAQPNAEAGGMWTKFAGYDAGPARSLEPIGQVRQILIPLASRSSGLGWGLPGPNASAFFALGSGQIRADLFGQVAVGLRSLGIGHAEPSAAASSYVVFYPKGRTNASSIVGGIGVKLQLGPSQFLNIVSASSNGATTVLASAGIASTLASGLFVGQEHKLAMRVLGGQMDVWLATGAFAPSPILSASAVDGAQAGWPALGLVQGGNVSVGVIGVRNVLVVSAASPPIDIAARESFRFESYPEKRVIQGNASVFKAERIRDHRGDLPQLPPTGSPAATGPAQIVALAGEIDNFIGNDGFDFIAAAREQFTYLR